MEEVRKYVREVRGRSPCRLPTSEGEDCDLKVILEVFGRQSYVPAAATASEVTLVDCYEPTRLLRDLSGWETVGVLAGPCFSGPQLF